MAGALSAAWKHGDMDRFQYLLLLAGCLLVTLPLELVLRARVYRRIRYVLLALLPVVIIFSIWDLVGIWRDHWSYNPRFVTGWQLPGRMPIEELLFFIVVPLCGLLTFEAVGQILNRVRRPAVVPEPADG